LLDEWFAPMKNARSYRQLIANWLGKKWPPIAQKRLKIAFGAFLLVILLWPAPIVKTTVSQELRGTWMTHLGVSLMYYSTRLDETIADLAKHQINTLYPAIWNHGHTLFASQVVPRVGGRKRNPWVNLPIPFSDPVAGLVAQTQRQHLRLIPWLEYGLMIPINADIIKHHPDWLTQQHNHQISDTPAARSPTRQHFPHPLKSLKQAILGQGQGWLNPFHPEVQKFITDLIVEVVTRYPVDGIQLDDHFSLPIAYGYDPYTIGLYQAEHRGQSPPADPANPEWMRWRADHLTELMAKIHTAVKAARPTAIVSLSPNAPDYAYRTSLQDWSQWVKLGLLDEVIVQLYRPNLAALQTELDRPNLKALAQTVPLSIGLYTGPFNQAKPAQRLAQEVQAVRSAGYAGTSFFSWETTFWLFRGQ
jgi:uncharacterized lipoprotein YddW (UPF0748 family)